MNQNKRLFIWLFLFTMPFCFAQSGVDFPFDPNTRLCSGRTLAQALEDEASEKSAQVSKTESSVEVKQESNKHSRMKLVQFIALVVPIGFVFFNACIKLDQSLLNR